MHEQCVIEYIDDVQQQKTKRNERVKTCNKRRVRTHHIYYPLLRVISENTTFTFMFSLS